MLEHSAHASTTSVQPAAQRIWLPPLIGALLYPTLIQLFGWAMHGYGESGNAFLASLAALSMLGSWCLAYRAWNIVLGLGVPGHAHVVAAGPVQVPIGCSPAADASAASKAFAPWPRKAAISTCAHSRSIRPSMSNAALSA